MSDGKNWGARLKALRVRAKMKQEAAAAHLGISQAYISRLESGTITPSGALIERIEALLEDPAHRLYFDSWRETVRHSESLSSLIGLRDNSIRAVEFSAGFRTLGGVFETIAPGRPLEGLFSRTTDELFAILLSEGLFEGAVARTENLWCSADRPGAACFRVVNIPVRDDLGRWYVHSTHREVPPTAFEVWQRENDRPKIIRF